MAWYWVLLIVVLVQGVALFVFWLITRNQQQWASNAVEKIVGSSVTRAREELEAERKSKAKVESELQALAEEYKAVAVWYTTMQSKIGEEARHAFNKLVGSPSDLDRKLDELLTDLPTTTADESAPGEG